MAFGVAIIGGGIFVKEQHLPAVLACSMLSLNAIWSRSLKSAEATKALIPGDSSSVDLYSTESGEGKAFEDVLKRDDVKGVIIALPIVDAPAYIKKALAAGKHVLAEKPIAPDVSSAKDLIAYYNEIRPKTKATLGIAENFRFNKEWAYGAQQIQKLGKVTGFVVRLNYNMEKDCKWLTTGWRQKPEHQGGFLLDGGVHYTAGFRKLLGKENAIESLVAETALVQPYLPPVDSIYAILKTKTGVVGSYIHCAGTTMDTMEWDVACEYGQVKVRFHRVVTIRGTGEDAKIEEKSFERTHGVKEEVKAWAESIIAGRPHPDQAPELALGDLELLEKMLQSGGARQTLEFQHYV